MIANGSPYSVSPAAASRALTIPEVLGIALSFSQTSALAASSRVSTFWSDIAKTHLWEQLDTVIVLLELLAPMKPQQVRTDDGEISHIWNYSNDGTDFKWDRFSRYASQVKDLTISENDTFRGKKRSMVANFALVTIALTQPPGFQLLPNIRHLVCIFASRDNLHNILPFISPNLLDLELRFESTTPSKTVCNLLKFLKRRTANLDYLRLCTSSRASSVGKTLAELIKTTPKLTSVSIPRFYLTVGVVAALAELAELEAILVNYESLQEYSEDGTCFDVKPGQFPSLDTVQVEMAPARAAQLLHSAPSLSLLTHLSLTCQRLWHQDELRLFIEACSAVCINMKDLKLNMFSGDLDATSPIKFSDIRPLLRCSQLQELIIGYDFPFDLDSSDVAELGKAWPGLHVLSLCNDPYPQNAVNGSGSSIQVLLALAAHCPQLEQCGLFFNRTAPSKFDGILHSAIQSKHLRKLDVGTSGVPGRDPIAVGFFLGAICQSELSIEIGASLWYLAEDVEPDEDKIAAEWETVGRIAANLILSKSKWPTGAQPN